jgi:hypothetical protein
MFFRDEKVQMRWFWDENPYLSLAENMGTLSVFLSWISEGRKIEPLIAQRRPAFIDGARKLERMFALLPRARRKINKAETVTETKFWPLWMDSVYE